jgi:hypothetical protein
MEKSVLNIKFIPDTQALYMLVCHNDGYTLTFNKNATTEDLWKGFYELHSMELFKNKIVTFDHNFQRDDIVKIMYISMAIDGVDLGYAEQKSVQKSPNNKLHDELFRDITEKMDAKKISVPNLHDRSVKAITKQLNWLRSTLGAPGISLTYEDALALLERIRDRN